MSRLTTAQRTSLPVVDLGYEVHQAISFDQSTDTYNFSNIRFAQPPLGDLRFRAPVPAWSSANSSTVNNGSVAVICPQAGPDWTQANGSSSTPPPPDPRTSEDCLFLDVVVPQAIFNSSGNGQGAAVLVYIYGGGYVGGEKTGGGSTTPSGLLAQAQKSTGQQFIFVAPNYRLGAFGFLAGPTLQSDGTANAGFYDQRLALEWVQKYIGLFGGDPDRITVMGDSAGGGSIMHQITAYNGMQPTPFAQAIPQSAAWQFVTSNFQQEKTFNAFLQYANVTSLTDLRNLPTEALQLANTLQVATSPYGQFTYGPVVDGIFTSQLPGRALATGGFDSNLRLLIGHNADEGFIFTSPNVTSDAALVAQIVEAFPSIDPTIVNYINTTLYPPVFDGSQGYTSQFERAVAVTSDSQFTCNTFYMDRAFGNQTYSYQFDVGTAYHGADTPYVFALSDNTTAVPIVAEALQTYITTFVINGTPSNTNAAGVPIFPEYGANDTVVNLNTNISYIMDSNAGPRCEFWQQAIFS